MAVFQRFASAKKSFCLTFPRNPLSYQVRWRTRQCSRPRVPQQTPSPTDISPRITHKNLPRCGAQAPGCFLPKGSWGQALKISDSSLKTSHPWAEASVVVCTGARALNKDCFSSQNLTCVCSGCSQCFPSIYLPAMPKLRFYTEWTLLFLQADFSLGPGLLYKSREDEQKCLKIAGAIISTTTPPLCSSKGGTAHGEQERNFKLVIHGQRERSPMVTFPVKEGK